MYVIPDNSNPVVEIARVGVTVKTDKVGKHQVILSVENQFSEEENNSKMTMTFGVSYRVMIESTRVQ